MKKVKEKILFVSWNKYQRRSEVLAKILDADIVFLANQFKSGIFRMFDYINKLTQTYLHIRTYKPTLVLIQSPPTFACLIPYLLGIDYILDIHNATFQTFWKKEPLLKFFLQKSKKIIVHNNEIKSAALRFKSEEDILVINDPLEKIEGDVQKEERKVTFICSFGEDEPIDLILETIEKLPDYNFFITANVKKLNQSYQKRFLNLPNLTLTGFLELEEYHQLLLSSKLLVVLTNREGCQPSGACEAISANTGLILSKTNLTMSLFQENAIFVNNDSNEIISAITNNTYKNFNHDIFFSNWNKDVLTKIEKLQS